MAEQQKKKEKESEGPLVSAAKTIGWAAGKVASLAGATAEKYAKPEYKEGTYESKYIGSGTFLISKPKRKRAKLRQSRLKGTVRGARK
jgi:hypothetical protein